MSSASCGGSSKGSSRMMVWRMLHTQGDDDSRHADMTGAQGLNWLTIKMLSCCCWVLGQEKFAEVCSFEKVCYSSLRSFAMP